MVIDSLYKAFPTQQGSVSVLEGFSLQIPTSSIVALVGPSGCGKTTLIKDCGRDRSP